MKLLRIRILPFMVLGMLAGQASADEVCNDAHNLLADHKRCARAATLAIDTEQKQVFDDLVLCLPEARRHLLENAQGAWQVYRGEQAAFDASEGRTDTDAYPMAYERALQAITKQRVNYLKAMLDQCRNAP